MIQVLNKLMALQSLTYPPSYPRPFPNNAVWAARTYMFDSFVDSFEAGDERKFYNPTVEYC